MTVFEFIACAEILRMLQSIDGDNHDYRIKILQCKKQRAF